MSYLVLARKWRPQRFDDVVGQEHVTRTLRNAIERDRVAHAYLFTGTRGVGKTTTARIFAKALNCVDGPTPAPCNACDICTAINNGSSLDVFEIDGASNNGVNEIRDLREKVRYAPVQARTKVYIIDEVHMLSAAAFNALLKTLEEPPPSTVFIFATTEGHKIPPTILSRCQRLDLHLVSPIDLVTHLRSIAEREQAPINDSALWLVARAAQGSVRDALSLLDQLLSYGLDSIDDESVRRALGMVGRDALMRIMAALCARETAAVLAELQEASQHGYDMKQFCRSLLEHVRDHLVIKAAADPSGLVNLPMEEIEELRKCSANVGIETLQQYFQALYDADEQMRWAPNAKLVLELALVKMSRMSPVMPIEEILAKLDELDVAVEASGGGSAAAPDAPYTVGLFGESSPPRAERIRESSPPAQPTEESAYDPTQSGPPPGPPPGPPQGSGASPVPFPQPADSAPAAAVASADPGLVTPSPVQAPEQVSGNGKHENSANITEGMNDLLNVKAAIDRAAEQHPDSVLHLQLAAAKLVGVGESGLTLELSNEFDLNRIQPSMKSEMQRILGEILNRQVTLTLTCAESSADESPSPTSRSDRPAAAALENEPIVQAALQYLDGEVLEISYEERSGADAQSINDEGETTHG